MSKDFLNENFNSRPNDNNNNNIQNKRSLSKLFTQEICYDGYLCFDSIGHIWLFAVFCCVCVFERVH